ncbi:hypothetical protein [Algicola sagamiensis]|uniref:hypothetical protein n=1 Tax=Algicola sagamiensis TaxID=163869 RepID=UPI000368ED82|nr:hypothetical protein [Algicola sagamiensis]
MKKVILFVLLSVSVSVQAEDKDKKIDDSWIDKFIVKPLIGGGVVANPNEKKAS